MAAVPATNVRIDVVRWLVANIRAELPGVQVEPGWPGANLDRETIWVDTIEGDFTIPVSMTGRRVARDDKFMIPLEVRVVGKSDLDKTSDRLGLLLAGVENLMANSVTLRDEIGGIESAELRNMWSLCARTPEGIRGYGHLEIFIHSRLH